MARLTFHLIPHTHWDREWYLPRAAFQARLVPLLDQLLDQLERQPDARFVLDGQTILLEDYLAVRPGQFERLAAQVRRGALEVGPWYVLADELIPSAASLRRNLEEGRRDAGQFGKRMEVLYSPDAFGHPAELPTLAAEAGLRFGVAWRGVGRPEGRDRDLYRWRSADDSLPLYHLPRAGYEIGAELGESNQLAPHWARIRPELVARAVTPHIAVFVGADHHAPPVDLVAMRDRLRALEPEHEVRLSGLTEYFEALGSGIRKAGVLTGEFRHIDGHTWVLQGVHGTRTRMKRRFSRAELFLSRVAEPLARRAAPADQGRADLVRHTWRTLLQCQFHDTLCGTCSDTVAAEQEVRLGAVEAAAAEIAVRSLHELAGHDPDRAREDPDRAEPRLILWNPADRARGGVVTADVSIFRRDVLVGPPSGRTARVGAGYRPFALEMPTGELLPVQPLGVRPAQERLDADRHYPDQDEVDRISVAFRMPEIGGFGMLTLAPRSSAEQGRDTSLEAGNGFIRNGATGVQWSSPGTMLLEDRRSGARYAGLGAIEDETDAGDCYTASIDAGAGIRRARHGGLRIVAGGPLIAALESTWQIVRAGGGAISGRLLVALREDSPVVRLRLDVENQATNHRLRMRFPVGAGMAALAGTALGCIERLPVPASRQAGAIEQGVRTAPAHRFVAAAAGSRGLVLLAPGFFEYEWTGNQELVVTLLRSVGQLSRGDLRERPGHAAWPMATPGAQEPGRHTIELALAPCDAAALEHPERLERLWEDEFLPVQSRFIRDFTPRA
jgi:hypothetical protein